MTREAVMVWMIGATRSTGRLSRTTRRPRTIGARPADLLTSDESATEHVANQGRRRQIDASRHNSASVPSRCCGAYQRIESAGRRLYRTHSAIECASTANRLHFDRHDTPHTVEEPSGRRVRAASARLPSTSKASTAPITLDQRRRIMVKSYPTDWFRFVVHGG